MQHLINQNIPNSFNRTIKYFRKFANCVLIFIRDPNLKSVSQTLRQYKSDDFYKKGQDKLIKNYNAVLDTLEKEKSNNTVKGDLIKNIFITSSMGVSYKLKLQKSI